MLLKGNFETFFLASILQLLCNDRKTGLLRVVNGKKEVKIVFQKGDIVYAVAQDSESRLGPMLLKKNMVSKKRLEDCLKLARMGNQPLDQVLVDKGVVSRDQIQAVVNKHVEEIIFNLFLWEKGEFEYKDARINLKGAASTRLNTTRVLLEASRRIDEMSIIRKRIKSDEQVFKIAATIQDKEEVKLNAEEWRILSLVDGARNVNAIIKESGYGDFIVYKVLYSLISSGLIDTPENLGGSKKEPSEKKTEDEFKKQVPYYSAIVMVYLDVFHVIRRKLEVDLGKHTETILEECKPDDLIFQRTDIFRHFSPSKPHATNIHNVLGAMKAIPNFEEGRLFLVNSFNLFLQNLLNRAPEILGAEPTIEMIEEIEETLTHVNSYQTEAIGKSYILNDIQVILAKTMQHVIEVRDSKRGFGGLFSIFGRKDDFDF